MSPPGKMWVVRGKCMQPVMPLANGATPWYSSQYAALPESYAQDASLEIAWSSIALEQNNIAGEAIIPFISQGLEGFDINEPEAGCCPNITSLRVKSVCRQSAYPFIYLTSNGAHCGRSNWASRRRHPLLYSLY